MPLGAWKPIRDELGIQPGQILKHPIIKGLGLALLGVTWVACGILSVSGFYIGRFFIGTILALGCVVGGFLFLIFYRKFTILLETQAS